MALTLRRWALVAVLGCAAVAIAYWPIPIELPDFSREATPSAADIVQGDLYQTQLALAVLEQRDAVLASLRKELSLPGGARIVYRTGVSPAARAALTQALDSVAAALRPLAPEVTTTVVITSDSSPIRHGLAGYWYLMPGATDGHDCLVLAYTNDVSLSLAFSNVAAHEDPAALRSRLAWALGPCAFYAAFGRPGAGIEHWLREHNYRYAWSTDWRTPQPTSPSSRGRPVPGELTRDLLDVLLYVTGHEFDWGPNPLPVRACAHGDESQCRAVLALGSRAEMPPLGARYAVARWGWWWSGSERAAWSTPVGWFFLADLVRSAGRDRFQRFWRSPLPLDRAFATTMDMSIEQYTHRWLRGRFPAVSFGPNVTRGSILLGLALLAALVSVTAFYAMRRQVA